ncbi:conserved hypothetical protein [Isorropodon fossajaponicum endosymbiont JTNG4]|uniref:HNH endonuclease n=1 Tax=Isorropodon fossajaponicum symbiont TaxID=883811 RepID=UPI0019162657|nr:HNH endonuclease [Isorropodon fossajaponicum symbiont]BBB23855.1 conserved hypothetical protein [Isorropodon fossajaponicum endosymbiont JTNG4]
MKITQFDELWTAVNRVKIDKYSTTEVKQFSTKGIESNLEDIFDANAGELLTVLKDGSIKKAIVHVSDITNWSYSGYARELPKFHIFECSTLSQMRSNNRGHRYKKAGRSDGKFWIVQLNGGNFEKLDVCRNCLRTYNKKYNVSKYGLTPGNFDLQKYLNQKLKHLQPSIAKDEDMTTVPQAYSKNWSIISKTIKTNFNYTCQECYKDLSQYKKYLHTHHIDANKSNNNHGNLKVLCIGCHAEEFKHSHIKSTPQYKEYILMRDKI